MEPPGVSKKIHEERSRFVRAASLVLLSLVIFSVGSGCSGNGQGGRGDAAPVTTNVQRANPDILTEGDRIVIIYSGIPRPPPPHTEQIRQDGTIQPPYLSEPMRVAGLTTGELQDALYSLYVPKIFTRVSLTVKAEERYFTVVGEVNTPGLYPYIGTMTVLDGIASARGLNNFAKKNRIRVTRADGTTVTFDYSKARDNQEYNIPLYPGDVINVPRRLY
ncbi:MAG: hypothetical protein M2R45_02303 [Verrucomicrobia subdivision 3 bacterium]|nr:hypothetical protein [Limisphaerales bacterium]MCS1414682.1 hypothetical protein [Limisphaerales bacterium]